MTSNAYNENDLGFLISRRLDGDLTPDERQRLESEIQRASTLRLEAQQMAAVNSLVRRWARDDVNIDWTNHAALITARMESDIDHGAAEKVDGVLACWAAKSPDVDQERFTEAVLKKIRARRRAPAYAVILRYGLPLAAAAVFVFMVTAAFWSAPPVSLPVRSLVRIERPVRDGAVAAVSSVRSVVSFSRPAEPGAAEDEGIGLLTLGVSATRVWAEASPM